MATNTIRTSNNLTDDQEYFLIYSPSTKKLSDASGEILEIQAFCIYEEEKEGKDGTVKIQTLLSILTIDNEVYGTNSATFIKTFEQSLDFFEAKGTPEKAYRFLVDSGNSKAGREFIQCVYAPR